MQVNPYLIGPQVHEYTDRSGHTTLQLQARIYDREVRNQVNSDFNGYEKVFALVPHDNGHGGVSWERMDLKFDETTTDRGGNTCDWHRASLDVTNLDRNAIEQHGVAFGMEIQDRQNHQDTVWAQNYQQNYKPTIHGV